jgi:hypothetical protein
MSEEVDMSTTRNAGTIVALASVYLMASCDRTSPVSEPQRVAAPSAEVVELARDPAKLKELRRLCREDRENVDETLCVASARASRQRFMGDGKTTYTPEPVELPDAELPEPKRE